MSGQNVAPQLSAQLELMRLTTGHWITQAIYVAATLGIADLLQDGPVSCTGLAQTTGANAQALYRIMRALASIGVFAEEADGRFVLTPLAECLITDRPQSMRAWAMFSGEPYSFQPWGELLYSSKASKPAFEHVHGVSVFEYLSNHPEQAEIFNAAMTGSAGPEIAAVMAEYEFADFGTIVDVGGGHGKFLTTILRATPETEGILADLPMVVEAAERQLRSLDVASRCKAIPIGFFDSVPAGGDAYILKRVIHN